MIQGNSIRKVLWYLFPILTLGFVSCDTTTFTIPKGWHRSTNKVKLITADELVFKAMFDDSAIYTTVDPTNQGDINKLYGFSDCTSQHQKNSARFGWRWLKNQLEILTYTYVDGVRYSKSFGAVPLNETLDYAIRIQGDKYVFTLGTQSITMDRGCSDTGLIKYMLWPYFGGDETAPHEITIWLEEQD